MVATNVAARGLDIPEVDLIVQLEPPKEIDTYIHRSGRTGRAGKSGVCLTFYTRQQLEIHMYYVIHTVAYSSYLPVLYSIGTCLFL